MLLALLISLIAAVVPAILYVLLFYWADRYEREPLWLASVAFLWGAIPAIILSLIFELALGAPFVNAPGTLAEELVAGAVVAPIVEEIFKGAALLAIFFWKRQEFDGVLDGIVYGALIGFGFAMTENFFYFIGAFDQGGWGNLTVVIILRAVIFGLNHAFYTGLMGIGLGLARNSRNRLLRLFWIVAGLAAAILAHALHNFGAGITAVNLLGLGLSLLVAAAGFGLTLLAIGLSWQHERSVIRTELTPEIGFLLTREELHGLIDRWRHPHLARRGAPRKRQQLLVEFANRKRRLRLRGADREPELQRQLDDLRRQLALAA